MRKERTKKKLTRPGRQAGARVQRVQPWRRLREALLDHPCRPHDTARDPLNCTRSARGTSRAAFLFIFVGSLETLVLANFLPRRSDLLSPFSSDDSAYVVVFHHRRREKEREKKKRKCENSFYFLLF